MKKGTRNMIIIIILIVIIFLLSPFIVGFYRDMRGAGEIREIEKTYQQDAEQTRGADTPEAVWQEFKSAIDADDTETALEYVALDARDEMRSTLSKEAVIANIKSAPLAITEVSRTPCDTDYLGCQENAEYYFEFDAPAETIEFNGKKVELDAERVRQKIIFIKNLAGKWQLYF